MIGVTRRQLRRLYPLQASALAAFVWSVFLFAAVISVEIVNSALAEQAEWEAKTGRYSCTQ